jgi:ribosomal protein L37AE/L43A
VVTQEVDRRDYPEDRRPDYREPPRRAIPEDRRGNYREPPRRAPPRDWERQIEDRASGRIPSQRDQKKGWFAPDSQAKPGKTERTRDRFVCENCGNPSLQFFADGLGRCPTCSQRFRYSTRPASIRSKQKHKQFICSQCDSKNLQFFLDGRGICPQCKREFRWKK